MKKKIKHLLKEIKEEGDRGNYEKATQLLLNTIETIKTSGDYREDDGLDDLNIDIHRLIEREGDKVLRRVAYELPPEVVDLNGIERLNRLRRLEMPEGLGYDLSPLSNATTRSTLEVLVFTENSIEDLVPLRGCNLKELVFHQTNIKKGMREFFKKNQELIKSLKILVMGMYDGEVDFSFLREYALTELILDYSWRTKGIAKGLRDNENMIRSLRKLDLSETNVNDISFLQGYNIRCLNLNGCRRLRNLEPGFKDNVHLKKSLRVLNLDDFFDEEIESKAKYDISCLKGYSLNELSLNRGNLLFGHNKLFRDNPHLKRSLRILRMSLAKNVIDYSFLRGYSLEELDISVGGYGFSGFVDAPYRVLFGRNPRLSRSLRLLNASRLNLFEDDDLRSLSTYGSLEDIDLEKTGIRSLAPLVKMKAFRDKKLKKVNLEGFSNWLGVDHKTNISNMQAMRMLNEAGVEVKANVSYSDLRVTTLIDTRDEFINKYGYLIPDLYDYIKPITEGLMSISELKEGYGSMKVVRTSDKVIKITSERKARIESLLYELADSTPIKARIPSLLGSVARNGIGIILLGYIPELIDNKIYEDFLRYDYSSARNKIIVSNIKLMADFHSQITSKARINGYEFNTNDDHNSNSSPDFSLCTEPMDNSIELFREHYLSPDKIAGLMDWSDGIVSYIRQNANTVIHGDWKPENTEFGRLYDFSDVRLGVELEDVMRYLTSSLIRCSPEEAMQHVRGYIKYRSSIDPEFRDSPDRKNEMIRMAPEFYKFEGALYFLRSAKRDLKDPQKMEERAHAHDIIVTGWN